MANPAGRLFDDLLNIEVNTLVKAGMTGRKMPAIGHAFLDIFGEYDIWLCAHGGDLNTQWKRFLASPDGTADAFLQRALKAEEGDKWWIIVKDKLREGIDVATLFNPDEPITAEDFDLQRERARIAMDMYRVLTSHGYPVEPGADIMLRRILRNGDQLKTILASHKITKAGAKLNRSAATGITGAEQKFSSDDVITIRKAWELGTEVIVMQTVVQLDGDIVTRINEASKASRDQPLRDLHRQNVASAIGHWRFLVDTFVRVTTKAVGYLTG